MFALIGYGLLGVVVAVGVVSLLVLVLPADHLATAPRDVVPAGLPVRPEIRGDDVARVRLPVTLRGYRMVDTDAILDRLAFELERRDQEIDNLRQRAGLPPQEPVEGAASVSPSDAPSSPLSESDALPDRDEVLLPVGAVTASRDTAPALSSATEDPSHPVVSHPVPSASSARLANASHPADGPSDGPTGAANEPADGATNDVAPR